MGVCKDCPGGACELQLERTISRPPASKVWLTFMPLPEYPVLFAVESIVLDGRKLVKGIDDTD